MKIIIDTQTREIREEWGEGDKQIDYRALQKKKLEAVSMALGAQLVVMYNSDKDRIRALSVIFTNLIDSMKHAIVGDPKDPDKEK